MKLYYFPIAPNPTRVRIYLGEKGLEVPSELVNLIEGQQKSEAFLAKNPLGKLPVLELDDGTHVTESLPIIEYFEELHPDPPMWGSTPEERIHARAVERLCDLGVLIQTARWVHASNSPLGLPQIPAIAESARADRRKALTVLDGLLAKRRFVAGDRVTVGDCTLCAGLAFGRFRDVDLEPEFENVHRWWAEFQKRPTANPG